MVDPWLGSSPRALVAVLAAILVMYVTVLFFTRLVGLRSLSKADPIDLTITVAIGGVIAIAIMAPQEPIVEGVVALVGLYSLQAIVARLRTRSPLMRRWIENNPILLVYRGEIIEEHMDEADMTKMDLMEALREHDVASMDEVSAVVMERTGEFSVVTRKDGRRLEETVFDVVHLGERWDQDAESEEEEREEKAEEALDDSEDVDPGSGQSASEPNR